MDNNRALSILHAGLRIHAESEATRLANFVSAQMKALKRDGVILGLSGGVDSAVVAALCARAVGTENTLALLMPDRESAPQHLLDATSLARSMGIPWCQVDLTPMLAALGTYRIPCLSNIPLWRPLKAILLRWVNRHYARATGRTVLAASLRGFQGEPHGRLLQKGAAYYRTKHRLRMVLLYQQAERENRLVVGAADRTEHSVGFFVKQGCDHGTDIMPIQCLYKTQVRALAEHLGLPTRLIAKASSPDLMPGMDEDHAIGVQQPTLDLILAALERGWTAADTARRLGVEEATVRYVRLLTQDSEHMRHVYEPPPPSSPLCPAASPPTV